MPLLDLRELVRNRTMSSQMAALLAATAQERRSFLVVAIPRLAGKSTVMEAMLDRVAAGVPVRWLRQHPADVDRAAAQPPVGYLAVPEVSEAPVPGYIWGEPVRRVFALLERGYALATALHAPGLDDAFHVLTRGNGVPDGQASGIDVMVYLRSLGPHWQHPTRRVVAELHEVDEVVGGVPRARLLSRWDEPHDRFEVVEAPRRVGRSLDLEALATTFEQPPD